MKPINSLIIIFISLISASLNGQKLFPYRSDSTWGFCKSSGKVVIPPQYEYVSVFSRAGISTVKKNDKYGFINKKGVEITPVKYDSWSWFWKDVTYVRINNKYALINKKGIELTGFDYDIIMKFSEGVAGMKQGNYWGLLNKQGKELITPQYEDIRYCHEGMISVKLNNYYGFIVSCPEIG